jgi:sugar lactone lactonase YvrE
LSANDPRFGDKKPKLIDDLDIDGDMIYFVDSSYVYDVNHALEESLEGHARGRLFSFNQKTNKLALLLDNLYFPNGLTLGPKKDYVLISESTVARITKFVKKKLILFISKNLINLNNS